MSHAEIAKEGTAIIFLDLDMLIHNYVCDYKGTDRGQTIKGFRQVRVDGRTRGAVDTLDLTTGFHVERAKTDKAGENNGDGDQDPGLAMQTVTIEPSNMNPIWVVSKKT